MADPFFVASHEPLVKSIRHVVINTVLQVCSFAVLIVEVALPEWFSYCYFHWNLYQGKSWLKSLKDRVTGVTIGDVHDDLCGEFSPVIDGVCKDFCGNVKLLEVGGIVFLLVIAATLLITLAYIIINLILMRRGALPSKLLYVPFTQHGLWVPSLLYLAGIALYLSIGNVYGLNHPAVSEHGFEHMVGLPLAYAAYGLILATAVQGFIYLGPMFESRKDQFDYLHA